MKFHKIIYQDGDFLIRNTTTWNASATKSRNTFAVSEDGGKTWKRMDKTEANYLIKNK